MSRYSILELLFVSDINLKLLLHLIMYVSNVRNIHAC